MKLLTHFFKFSAFLLLALTAASAQKKSKTSRSGVPPSNPQLVSPEIERRVNALLAKMTLEEKLGQLVQYNTAGATSATAAADEDADLAKNPEANYKLDTLQMAETGRLGSLLNTNGGARISLYQHAAVEKSRLHIPMLFGGDVIHGYRTIYPIPLGLASSFDTDITEKVSRMAAEEATSAGIRWFYSPMVDVSRDARWGRVTEGAGEDAYLGAAMARAYVKGYQQDDLSKPDSVAATVKHFAAYGAVEAGREYNTTDMSDSRLRQVYLPPYKAAVDAGVATVMSAFNTLNGVPTSANPYLLDTILRKEWGFDGFVVSDYTSIMELTHHGTALDSAAATQMAFNAGVDVDMMSHFYDAELPNLIKTHRVKMAAVDEAVRRVLRVKFALGLFEHPYPDRQEIIAAVPEHRPLVRQAAEESFVLLQNNAGPDKTPVLPLKKGLKIALIGPLADAPPEMLGSWAGAFRVSDTITVRAALEERAKADGGSIFYAPGATFFSESDEGFADAEAAAKQADVVVLALGEARSMSGEAGSRAHLDLPFNQETLLEKVAAIGKPTVLLVFTGRPLVLTDAIQHVQSVLDVWYPGTEAGHAIANVLFGDVVPSGKLPMSFPQTEGQEPIYYNQFPTGRPAYKSNLDTFPGDTTRFISRYIDAPNAPLFPFGFGLSYTTFSYSGVKVSRDTIALREATPKANSLVTATVTVKNTGKVAGTEIVQCYVGNVGASLEQPVRSLEGFSRITLAPGESKVVSFPLGYNELSFWDNQGHEVIEPTDYTVWIGGSSLASSEAHFHIAR